jgi:beta-lactamase regulating signal transducer with metallopeptidase domain/DUF4097 and DUF4098 domain-containing protein YvlB
MNEAIILVAKATLVVVLAFAGTLLLRNASAALRHTLWSASLAAVLGLPVALFMMPAWQVALLPPEHAAFDAPVIQNADASRMQGPDYRPAAGATTQTARSQQIPSRAETGSVHVEEAHVSDRSLPLQAWLSIAWLVVAAGMLGRLLLGRIAIGRVARRGVSVDASWQATLDEERMRAGITRCVRIARSSEVSTPVTFGIRSPVILVPDDATSWDVQRRLVVTRHELAHIERHDAATQLVAASACVVYWFHPAVWLAARRLQIESERACDDIVLTRGTKAPEYAAHLLDVARAASRTGASAFIGIAMARPTHFEGRLIAILDATRQRGSKRRSSVIIATLSVVMVVTLAAFQPVSRGFSTTFETPSPVGDVQEPTESTQQPAGTHTTAQDSAARVVKFRSGINGSLQVSVAKGSMPANITINAGDSTSVTLRASAGNTDLLRSNPQAIRLDTSERGHALLMINTPIRAKVNITVPRAFYITLARTRGDVEVSGFYGRLVGEVQAGSITVRDMQGDANVTTDSGDVSVERSKLEGYVETRNGVARSVDTYGSVRVLGRDPRVARSGAEQQTVDVRSGDGLDAELWKEGEIEVDNTGIRVRESALRADREHELILGEELPNGGWLTAHGDIRLSMSAGPLYMRTTAGDIWVGSTAGDTWAFTSHGAVWISVKQGSQDVDIYVESGGGNVDLTLPQRMGATFDLVTGYGPTDAATHIEGPAALQHSTSANWEKIQGVPGKYVRASGRIGSGTARIHVRTYNGNITIHQH